ncbi:putative S-adenosylmethionine-dependent methyltransferase (plasmid) [Haloferax gibbonsii]|uniref:S-adenosylmethionine-dependent methyltransferase n=1 Tax=Haloferax gibbonsii TaxID=35746 RepID=A0A871BLN4_HALGI|nr:CBS domain-containing protein [Haloferax gibbonsii]QOS13603.1 putative S-adenosylmethionine-dependent methyltransferase [Haloferax gibbonsii]
MNYSEDTKSVDQVPPDVADEMVRRLFADGDPKPDDRILFPGAGYGELVGSVDRYCDQHGVDFPESVALETQEDLVDLARKEFELLPLDVFQLDFLGELPDLGEFDYVVSDPPVSRLLDIPPEAREDLAMRFDTISAGSPAQDEDLYLAFFEQGLRMLAPEGRLVFVTPDFTSKRGHLAIPEIKRRLSTFRIEDIDESPIESPDDDVDMDVVITTVTHAEPDPDYATEVDFDGVQEALTVAYDIGATDIMTQDPRSFYPSDDVHDVYIALVKNDYDAAPVRERGSEDCLGLVSKAELTGADTGTLADGYINEIDESRLIPATASFEETLEKLRSRRFCLVGSEDDVRGIVTRFDLNSMEVYFHLYAKFARFEIGLRNAIRDHRVDWEEALMDGGTDWEEVKYRKGKYSEKTEVSRDVLDTLLLSDLIKIVENSELRESLDFEKSELGVHPSAINDLRVAVAHYQPLIHTMDTISWTKRRTTGDFGDVYDALNDCLGRFESTRYV